MQVVDAHCHVSPVWFEPVETLLFHMDRHGVTHAVLTQLLGQVDNRYQQECLRRYPGRFVSVVAVDTENPSAEQHLRDLAGAGARGVRLRTNTRTPGADPHALWRVAAQCGMVVSCVGPAGAFLSSEFAETLHAFPSVRVLAEHLCGWTRPDCNRDANTWQGIRALSRFPNFCLKVPPPGELVKRNPTLPGSGRSLDLTPARVVLELVDAYGAERLCWASDFPVVSSREGYGNALAWSLELFETCSDAVRAQVFSGTARRLFRMDCA